ncbi:hypothetical protein GMW39_06810 [Pectobacterium parmentieri]|uniref:hypothetical protein n=1 Tax=Pectobacterium parmentieri TaxID=1905730 RepID=UPI0013742A1C|nr:hypothetical protein [Pectobacterium parmentieri]QHQ15599.1 hypothetical protein GMW39_06810 [Pectobacterium parmentieri]
MKRKITRRNKRFLTSLLDKVSQWDLPLHSVVALSASAAETKNAGRLARRGKLLPDWKRVEPWHGEFLLPFAGPSGKIYHYQIRSHRDDF